MRGQRSVLCRGKIEWGVGVGGGGSVSDHGEQGNSRKALHVHRVCMCTLFVLPRLPPAPACLSRSLMLQVLFRDGAPAVSWVGSR